MLSRIYHVFYRTEGFVSEFGCEWENGLYVFATNKQEAILKVVNLNKWTFEKIDTTTFEASEVKNLTR